MPDNQDSTITVPDQETVETAPTEEWLGAHRTTREEQQTANWAAERNLDVESGKYLKQALGQAYEGYSKQLEGLSSGERIALKDKSPEDIAAHLDFLAETERDLKKRQEEAEKQAAQQVEAVFALSESPEAGDTRRAMKTAFDKASSLDERIAELERLNELRLDPSDPGWDQLPAEKWKLAREGNTENLAAEIIALTQQRQAALQEAGLHQGAYYAIKAQTPLAPPPVNQVIGQIPGKDGQPIQITQADIDAQVQFRLDAQAHRQRIEDMHIRRPDWEQHAMAAHAAGVDITPQQVAFVMSLPNSADVVYWLTTHHAETRALARMSGQQATRELIAISHKVGRPSASETPRKTNAPKPPSTVSSGGKSRAFDVSDESLSADEWGRQRNADLKRRGKY